MKDPVHSHLYPEANLVMGFCILFLSFALYGIVHITHTTFTFKRRQGDVRHLPMPAGAQYIWGHEREILSRPPGDVYRSWSKELGLAYRVKAAFWAPDLLILSDPVGISHILQKKIFDYYHSEVVRPRIGRLLGKGMGWVEGQSEHGRMRRLVIPALNAEGIRRMSPSVRDAVAQVVDGLVDNVRGSKEGHTHNILDWSGKATLSVVGRAAFHHDFEGGNSTDAHRILNDRRVAVGPILRYTGFLTYMLLRRFPILNSLPIFALQAQGIAKTTIQTGVAREMVKRDFGLEQDDSKVERADLLTLLLKAAQERVIDRKELFEHISTFILAGHETTTITLGFTIWELARNPDMQRRLRAELDMVSKEPSYDEFLSNTPYLDAVLKETLRIYPPLPNMERVATKEDIIPLGSPFRTKDGRILQQLKILPGQTVVIPITAIQNSEIIWKDADTFRPERWLEKLPPQESLCSGWSNLLAFSDGPRKCIGQRLAIFQYKVIMTQLFQKFRFESTEDHISLKISSSIQPVVVGREIEGPQLPIRAYLL